MVYAGKYIFVTARVIISYTIKVVEYRYLIVIFTSVVRIECNVTTDNAIRSTD